MEKKSLQSVLQAAHRVLHEGRLQQAIVLCENVIKQVPDCGDAYSILGIAYYLGQSYRKAIVYLEKAKRLSSNNPEIYNNIGIVYFFMNQRQKAEMNFQQAIQLDPNFYQGYYNKALSHYGSDAFLKAEATLKAANHLVPEDAKAKIEYNYLLAKIFSNTGNNEGFEKALQAILKINPSNANALNLLGHKAFQKGDLTEAESCFRQAIKHNSKHSEAYFNLSRCRKFTTADPERQQLEELLASAQLLPDERKRMHFALGKIYHDCKLYDDAWRHYKAANDLIANYFDHEAANKLLIRVKETFTAEYFKIREGYGRDDIEPIFITGMPRSGSTLTEQIISSHPDVFAAGESKALNTIKMRWRDKFNLPYPEFYARLTATDVALMAEEYLQELGYEKHPEKRFTDKFLGNIWDLGLIYMMFPKSKIIYCERNALDTCLSIYMQNFRKQAQTRSDLVIIGQNFVLQEELIKHWQQVYPEPIFLAHYEVLVSRTKEKITELMSFCGLDAVPECFEFYQNEREVATASMGQVVQPIYTSSVNRWKHYDKYLDELKETLGISQKRHKISRTGQN